jgi:integrase
MNRTASTARTTAPAAAPVLPGQSNRADGPVVAPVPLSAAAVTGLADVYAEQRAAAGRPLANGELSRIRKHLFWLVTGRLPARGFRGWFDYSDLTAIPGWTMQSPWQLSARVVDAYLAVLQRGGEGAAAGSNTLTTLHVFYDWLVGREANVTRTRKAGNDRDSSTAASYTREQVQAMLDAADRAAAAVPRDRQWRYGVSETWLKAQVDRTVLYLLWSTGASGTALCTLPVDAVDLTAGVVRWPDPEGTRVQLLPPAAVEVLRFYLAEVRPRVAGSGELLLANPRAEAGSGFNPQSVQHLARRFALAAGLPAGQRHTPTRWAHAYNRAILATRLGGLATVMRLLGHAYYTSARRTYGGHARERTISLDDIFGTAPATGQRTG